MLNNPLRFHLTNNNDDATVCKEKKYKFLTVFVGTNDQGILSAFE